MGAGYHGGFGKTKGNSSHEIKEQPKKKPPKEKSLIDKNLVSEMENNQIKC